MKAITLKSVQTVALAALLVGGSRSSAAAPAGAIDRVQLQNAKVLVWQGGKSTPATEAVELPDAIKVQTNGTYTVANGKERKLNEGETLNRDGMLARPDGSLAPVFDHVMMKRGKVALMKDGETSVVSSTIIVPGGTSVYADGSVMLPTGSRRRLLDGELFRLDGKAIATKDTITLQQGKVMVQKDGSMFSVAAGRNLTMNDGTKVFGDGTVIKADGTRVTLREGDVITIDGVVRK